RDVISDLTPAMRDVVRDDDDVAFLDLAVVGAGAGRSAAARALHHGGHAAARTAVLDHAAGGQHAAAGRDDVHLRRVVMVDDRNRIAGLLVGRPAMDDADAQGVLPHVEDAPL